MAPRPTTAPTLSAIKKPMNSFFLYRRAIKELVIEKCNTRNSHEVSQIAGEWWAKESPETKAYFRKLAADGHTEHKEKFPDFDWYILLNIGIHIKIRDQIDN